MSAPVAVDIAIDDPRWEAAGAEPLVLRGIAVTLAHVGLRLDQAEVSVLLTDDARMRLLNAEYRDKDRPTNVLSWPAEELAPEMPGGQPAAPAMGPDGLIALGDLALGWETVAQEASDGQTTALDWGDYVTRLVVHGMVHLLGYDHETPQDALLMEALEHAILHPLGLSDEVNYAAERAALLDDLENPQSG